MAGFTTLRDLGTEGAGYADVGLKQAIEPGHHSRAAHARRRRARSSRPGSYGPKGFDPRWDVPQGAEEADGVERLMHVVRDQIGHGADWVKIYARLSLGAERRERARPSREDELDAVVETARSERARRSPCTRRTPKGCAARSSPAWRRSSTATTARRRSSG